MRKLEGQVAIVTGASSGVGWVAATHLAKEGVKLCVTARRAQALQALCREIEAAGGECIAAPGDVTSTEDVERVVQACIDRYGRVDILVSAAGVQSYSLFEQYEWRQIERVFDTTCFGYFRFARAVIPHFRKQGHGHLINVLSMLALGGAPLLSAYAAAKHALWGWSQSLKVELAGSGIDVSNIFVPSVATPMFDHAPTNLGLAPQPIPPTYHPNLIGRDVVRCAKRPNSFSVPSFLQGSLILWMQRLVPGVGEFILRKWGIKMQTRPIPVDRREGNLFRPVEQGVGPTGSVPPTPGWIRYAASTLIVGTAGAAGVGLWRGLGVLGGERRGRRTGLPWLALGLVVGLAAGRPPPRRHLAQRRLPARGEASESVLGGIVGDQTSQESRT